MLTFKDQEEFEKYLKENLICTGDAVELLGISRQGIDYHVKNGNLKPRIIKLLGAFYYEKYCLYSSL